MIILPQICFRSGKNFFFKCVTVYLLYKCYWHTLPPTPYFPREFSRICQRMKKKKKKKRFFFFSLICLIWSKYNHKIYKPLKEIDMNSTRSSIFQWRKRRRKKKKSKKKKKKKKKKKNLEFSRIFANIREVYAEIRENARIFGKLFVGGTVHLRASHSQRARISKLKSISSKLLIWILRTAGETPLGVGLVFSTTRK